MFEDSITEDAKQKYILLELDTFYFENSKKTSTAYCLIEHTPIQEMGTIDQFLNLHKNEFYQKHVPYFVEVNLENIVFCSSSLLE